jgi:uracil-DNA glycosylase
MLLRNAMLKILQGWGDDLSPSWRTFFAAVEPDFEAISEDLTFDPAEPVIPSRKGLPLIGAPPGAHIFRAFDAIAPKAARVVIIGQDPYPRISRATGRAFEDGALTSWNGSVAVSLQHLVQSALSLRLARPELAVNAGGWATIRREIAAGTIALEPPRAYFDRLQESHGVLFVNAGWTLTRFMSGGGPEQQAHIALWHPLMTRLLNGLSDRDDGRIVFLLLGGFAQRLFKASGVEAAAKKRGIWGLQVLAVAHPHPNTSAYFEKPNPLQVVNTALAAMKSEAVLW